MGSTIQPAKILDQIAGMLDGIMQADAAWCGRRIRVARQRLKAGKLRALALMADKRTPYLPDVPTFKELGYDLVSGAYRGIAVPKSTPKEIQAKLSNMIKEINADPEFRKKMENDGMALLDVDVDGYDAFVKKMTDVYSTAAREAGIIQ